MADLNIRVVELNHSNLLPQIPKEINYDFRVQICF